MSGLVSASFSAPISRAFSRSSTGCGKLGLRRMRASTSSACSRSCALESVRSRQPARSVSKRAAELRADVGERARDLVFVHAVRAEPQQVVGHARDAGLLARVEARAGREIDADVEHRQVVVLDEIHARAALRLPVLDRQQRVRGLRDTPRKHAAPTQRSDRSALTGHGAAPGGGAARASCPQAAADRGTATVSVSSTKYCCATACTCSAVTRSASRLKRSIVRCGSPIISSEPISPRLEEHRIALVDVGGDRPAPYALQLFFGHAVVDDLAATSRSQRLLDLGRGLAAASASPLR